MSVGLRVENIKKVYDKNIALNGVSLDIRPGEFVCLLGPSGCGKSSLLRIIAGLDKPNEGSVYINERNVTRLPPQRRNFGIMFQSYALFPNLTAFENVAYGLRNKKIKTRDADERVNRLFEMIKLSNSKNKLPAQMSGGEQQRVALARALATEPDFLLLDEPLSALDAKVRLSLRKQICAIQREMGLTTIMVTHDQEEALTMADRIVVMNKAEVMQCGTPEEVYQTPENPFVADFIGSINFISKRKDHIYQADDDSGVFAIRPEKIHLRKQPEENSVRGVIEDIEFRGSFYRVSAVIRHVARRDTSICVDVPFMQAKKMKLTAGETVYLQWPEEEMLSFQTVKKFTGSDRADV